MILHDKMKQVWCRKYLDERNIKIDFIHSLRAEKGMALSLAANVSFRLTIDGMLVGYGPNRRAAGRAAVNLYDLSPWAGREITLKVETVSYRVWNYYIMNQRPFFAAEITLNDKTIVDSLSFSAVRDKRKLQKVQRYGFQRGFTEVYDYTIEDAFEPLVLEETGGYVLKNSAMAGAAFVPCDFSLYESGRLFFTDAPDFDDSYYNRGKSQFFPKNEQYRITEILQRLGFVRENAFRETLCGAYRIYALPHDRAGFVQLETTVIKPARLIFEYDEKLSPTRYEKRTRSAEYGGEHTETVDFSEKYVNGAANVDIHRLHCISAFEYRLPTGEHKLLSFEPDAMKYLRISVIEGEVIIKSVKFIPYEFSDFCRPFESNDKSLQLLYDSAVRTFRANAVDILTDCPSRERAGWLCDSYFSGRAERFLTGKNMIERNFLENYAVSDGENFIPKEMFPMCYPADHPDGKFIPNWGLWLILEVYCFEKANPALGMAEKFRDRFVKFIGWLIKFVNGEGLLENVDGWCFVEWSRANDLTKDVNFPTNMLFCAAMKAMAELYGEKEYAAIAARTENAVYHYSFDGEYFCDRALRKDGTIERDPERTETCQYYAFYFGFADKERNPHLYETMFEKIRSFRYAGDGYDMYPADAFIGIYLKLDYLYRIGEYDLLKEEVKNYFLYQAEETGTFWEYREPRASCCHGFAAIIAEWVFVSTKGENIYLQGMEKIFKSDYRTLITNTKSRA